MAPLLASCGEPPQELPELEPLPADAFTHAAPAARAPLEAAAARAGAADPRTAAAGSSWSDLARLAHASDLLAAAAVSYRNANRLAPGDWRTPYLESVVDLELFAYAEALSASERALALPGGRRASVQVARARALHALGRTADAAAAIEEILREAPDDAAALFYGARIADDQGDFATAIDRFERLLAAQPGASRLQAPLSLLYRRVGRVADADLALGRSGDGAVWIEDETLQAVMALAPPAEDLSRRASQAFERGDFASAEQLFRTLAEASPADAQAAINLGAVLLRRGRVDDATREIDRALQIEPRSARAWFTRGVARAAAGDRAGAAQAYRKALEIDPQDIAARQNLANLLLRSGQSAAALDEYRAILAHEPTHALARTGVAAALAELGRFRDARRELESGFDPRSAAPQVLIYLSRLLAAAPDAATRDGRRALDLARLQPALESHAYRLETLAMALAESGDLAAAVSAQERALERARAQPTPDAALLARLDAQLQRYRRGEPCRDPALF